MKKRAKQEIHFAVCINNKKYEAFLEVGKLYRIIPVGDDVFNVPKNEALASVAPADPGSASLWAGYVSSWTAWNHVRTAAALAAAASFSIALGY